ncbi:hypothetical protein ES702_03141 [subsurface metagenome]
MGHEVCNNLIAALELMVAMKMPFLGIVGASSFITDLEY